MAKMSADGECVLMIFVLHLQVSTHGHEPAADAVAVAIAGRLLPARVDGIARVDVSLNRR